MLVAFYLTSVFIECSFEHSISAVHIHSFVSNIYIVPLQENYSEALPTPARLTRADLRWEKNIGEKVLR